MERELPTPHLRNEFEDRMVSVLTVMTLWERGAHIIQTVCCIIIVPKDVESLIGFRHEKLSFFKQRVTFDCSRRVSVDLFEDGVPGVSEYQNLTKLFSV